ncbi:MAG: hypothetical protein ACPGRE_08050 [Flavobacteriaceae bacterium]
MKTLQLTLILFLLASSYSFGQKGHFKDSTYSMDNYDIFDGLRKARAKKMLEKGDTIKKVKKQKKTYTMALPVVGYNPFTGLIIGVAGISSFRLGDAKTTRLSSVVPSYTYTTNKQNVFRVNSSLYTADEDYYVFNSVIWSVSPQVTYGVGGNTSNDWATEITPSTFSFVLRGYKKFAKNFYVGLNYRLDYKYNLEDNSAMAMQNIISDGRSQGQSASAVQSTIESKFGVDGYDSFWEQYEISQAGFEQDYNSNSSAQELQQNYYTTPFGYYPYGTQDGGYVYSGAGLNILFDSRDNINTPYQGTYANLLVNTYPTWLGSTTNSSQMYMDLRHYFKLKENATQILAFWALANITWGDTPYISMPRIGGDDWFASGRGYTAGRYVGEELLYLEAEYRMNVYKWFGINFFANATTVSEIEGGFDYVNPGYGVGFTFRAIKASRSTINLDLGKGKDGSTGVYMRFISAF